MTWTQLEECSCVLNVLQMCEYRVEFSYNIIIYL